MCTPLDSRHRSQRTSRQPLSRFSTRSHRCSVLTAMFWRKRFNSDKCELDNWQRRRPVFTICRLETPDPAADAVCPACGSNEWRPLTARDIGLNGGEKDSQGLASPPRVRRSRASWLTLSPAESAASSGFTFGVSASALFVTTAPGRVGHVLSQAVQVESDVMPLSACVVPASRNARLALPHAKLGPCVVESLRRRCRGAT